MKRTLAEDFQNYSNLFTIAARRLIIIRGKVEVGHHRVFLIFFISNELLFKSYQFIILLL